MGVVGGLAVVLGGVAAATPVITAHAACGTVAGSGIGLDPIVSQSDYLATPSPNYTWAGICGFTPAAATAPDGGAEVAVTIGFAAPLPALPTARGDIGYTITACSDMGGTIATSPEQIGVNHRGQPVFDGPYPPEDGYKWCTEAVVQSSGTSTTVDYGVETFSEIGVFTFTDYPALITTTGTATMTAPSWSAGTPTGSTSVTLYLPKTLSFRVNPPAPPFQGAARTFSETMVGATATSLFALTQVNAQVTLPFPVCVQTSPPGINCNGNPNTQVFGPLYGVAGVLATSGWAPGSITCSTVSGVPNPATCAYSAGAQGLDLGALPLPFEAQAVGTPCVDPLDPAIVDCATETPPNTNYNPCQSSNTAGGQDVGDLYAITSLASAPCPVTSVPLPNAYVSQYGLIWSGELPGLPATGGGRNFLIGPAFLETGVSF